MDFLKDLKKKTWIDWIKIFVAIDMAFVGIGLILNIHFHLLADSLGFLSRIPFGILYVFVAFIIFRKVFPIKKIEHDEIEEFVEEQDSVGSEVKETKNFLKKIFKKIQKIMESFLDFVDRIIDAVEDFFKKRFFELKDEIKNISKE